MASTISFRELKKHRHYSSKRQFHGSTKPWTKMMKVCSVDLIVDNCETILYFLSTTNFVKNFKIKLQIGITDQTALNSPPDNFQILKVFQTVKCECFNHKRRATNCLQQFSRSPLPKNRNSLYDSHASLSKHIENNLFDSTIFIFKNQAS